MSIDIDENLTAILLENGDVMIDNVGNCEYNHGYILAAIDERIDRLTSQIQRLRLIRDLVVVDEEFIKSNQQKE